MSTYVHTAWWDESTWALFSVAHFRLHQIWARNSPILWFFDDHPCSRFVSTVTSCVAFTPRLPRANLAVNWKRRKKEEGYTSALAGIAHIYRFPVSKYTMNIKIHVPGHWSVLQTIICSKFGHASPPFSGSSMTSLALVLSPPLQVALHLPHGFQSPTLQSTGNLKLWWDLCHVFQWACQLRQHFFCFWSRSTPKSCHLFKTLKFWPILAYYHQCKALLEIYGSQLSNSIS